MGGLCRIGIASFLGFQRRKDLGGFISLLGCSQTAQVMPQLRPGLERLRPGPLTEVLNHTIPGMGHEMLQGGTIVLAWALKKT